MEGTSMAIEGLRAWWIPFSDRPSGRASTHSWRWVRKPTGTLLGRPRRGEVLDSLAFDPEQQLTRLPPPIRDDYRSEFVSDERGYRFWPRSGPAERGAIYRFEVPHCGLDWLVDFDGSFWEPVYVMPDRQPDSAINSDIGTITLVEPDEARYVSSTDEQVSLFRVDGPIVRQLCD